MDHRAATSLTPQFCCGCFLREWASHPWYIVVELRVSPSNLELPKRPLRCPSQLSPPLRRVLRQSAKFSPFIPDHLATRFRAPWYLRKLVRRPQEPATNFSSQGLYWGSFPFILRPIWSSAIVRLYSNSWPAIERL